jgi:predicted transcriptional regulator of viral defense system
MTMTNIEKINEILIHHQGLITRQDLVDQNIPTWFLTDLVKKGHITRLSRGIYSNQFESFDTYFVFQQTHKRCIFSYQSALYLNHLISKMPLQTEVTVYKGYNSSKINDQIRVYTTEKKYYELGMIEKETQFHHFVKTYDMERTLCDMIKRRNEIDSDILKKAFRSYMKDGSRDIAKLKYYAKELKVIKEIDIILDVLAV